MLLGSSSHCRVSLGGGTFKELCPLLEHWKFDMNDIEVRQQWPDYQCASGYWRYPSGALALEHFSVEWCAWTIGILGFKPLLDRR